MRQTILLILLALLTLGLVGSCSGIKPKLRPEYSGVDTRLQPLVNEYLQLSAENNIHFKHKVSVGMKPIDDDKAVGVCNYGSYFREIDIDSDYWDAITPTTQKAILFHELTHCYCTRPHDYGNGQEYKSKGLLERVLGVFKSTPENTGFYPDQCPTSIMYPVVIPDRCMIAHEQEYIKEMFNHCRPW